MTRVESLTREMHLYLAVPDEWVAAEVAEAAEALLSSEEAERYAGFGHPTPRRLFLTGRALLRRVLSGYFPVAPESWRFRLTAHGRPEIDGRPGAPPLRFNLAHTEKLVACLVTLDRDCGVDVENAERRLDPVRLAERHFGPQEVADLRGLESEAQTKRFLGYWTLKEAYLKACGEGIRLGLDAAVFSFQDSRRVSVRFAERIQGQEANWQFGLYGAASDWLVAVAVRRSAGRDLSLVSLKAKPCRDDGLLDLQPWELSRLAVTGGC